MWRLRIHAKMVKMNRIVSLYLALLTTLTTTSLPAINKPLAKVLVTLPVQTLSLDPATPVQTVSLDLATPVQTLSLDLATPVEWVILDLVTPVQESVVVVCLI